MEYAQPIDQPMVIVLCSVTCGRSIHAVSNEWNSTRPAVIYFLVIKFTQDTLVDLLFVLNASGKRMLVCRNICVQLSVFSHTSAFCLIHLPSVDSCRRKYAQSRDSIKRKVIIETARNMQSYGLKQM